MIGGRLATVRPLAFFAASVGCSVGLWGGTLGAQVIHRGGSTVEFVGLKRWTVQAVEDSLRVYAPDVPINSAACAEVLGCWSSSIFRSA